MIKEVISLAVILSFIMNVIWVDHPNTYTYTVAFTVSLILMAPFLGLWIYWYGQPDSVVSLVEKYISVIGSERGVARVIEMRLELREAHTLADIAKVDGGADT